MAEHTTHTSHTSAGTDSPCRCAVGRDHFEDDTAAPTVAELQQRRNTTEQALLDAMDAVAEAVRLRAVAERAHRTAQREYTDAVFAPYREEPATASRNA